MRLNEDLLDRLEEYIDLIANEDEIPEIDTKVEFLREFLEKDVDGWTKHDEYEIATVVQDELEALWELLTPQEKRDNYMLEDHYDDIMQDLERIVSPESDADDYGDLDGEDDYAEESEEDDYDFDEGA